MRLFAVLLFAVPALVCAQAPTDLVVRLQSTPSLLPLAKDLVRPMREQGIILKLVEDAGNTQVIAALGEGEIDAALLTRSLNVDERVGFPARHFVETPLGTQAVAVVVARAVWDSGVHALKRDQVAGLYENKVRNWKEVGGEERPVVFFEPAHEHGPWEIFATWLYGDTRRAPAVAWQVVTDGKDTQTTLEFSSGGVSVAGIHWADRKDVFPLTVIDDAGQSIEPTYANIASGAYPLARPVILAFADEPSAQRKKLLEFAVSEKGQQLVAAHDYVPQSVLKKP